MIERLLIQIAADILTVWTWIRTGRTEPPMTDTADEPRTVYLTASDGTTTERIDCLLEELAPNHWQATPVRDIRPDEMLHVYIDKLPAGATVEIAFPVEDD